MEVNPHSKTYYILFIVAYILWGTASALLASYLTATYENGKWVIKNGWIVVWFVVIVALISAGDAWLTKILRRMAGDAK